MYRVQVLGTTFGILILIRIIVTIINPFFVACTFAYRTRTRTRSPEETARILEKMRLKDLSQSHPQPQSPGGSSTTAGGIKRKNGKDRSLAEDNDEDGDEDGVDHALRDSLQAMQATRGNVRSRGQVVTIEWDERMEAMRKDKEEAEVRAGESSNLLISSGVVGIRCPFFLPFPFPQLSKRDFVDSRLWFRVSSRRTWLRWQEEDEVRVFCFVQWPTLSVVCNSVTELSVRSRSVGRSREETGRAGGFSGRPSRIETTKNQTYFTVVLLS